MFDILNLTEGIMRTPTDRLRVVVATPLTDELCELIAKAEPLVEVVCEQQLLPPMRWPGDHEGDSAFSRSAQDQARFDALVDTADALYGIPDTSPAALARTLRANARLRWVHTMAAGGGGQVKDAGLTEEEVARVAFSTSAGPHSGPLAEFALFAVLAGAKSLPRLQAQKADKLWSSRWAMKQVSEMTVLVIGMGNIGRGVATRFAALGARVIGVNRHPVDVDGVAVDPDHAGTQRGESGGDAPADVAHADHQHGHLADLLHGPARAPELVGLLRLQTRQGFRAREDGEERELGQRAAVRAGRGRERHPGDLLLRQAGVLDLSASAGGHRVHPAQARVGAQRARERGGAGVGDSIEGVGGVDERVEPRLVLCRSREGGVAFVVARPAHRGQQLLFADDLDQWLRLRDELAELVGQWRCDDHPQAIRWSTHDSLR